MKKGLALSNQRAYKKPKGFTIIELLVVVTIIALLMAAGLVSYSSIQKRSRDARRRSDIEQVRSALEMYKADNGSYPETASTGDFVRLDTDSNLIAALVTGEYLSALPNDPKYNNVTYNYPYAIQMLNAVSGKYYSYCIAAALEITGEASLLCTGVDPPAGYNHSVKNP